MSQYVNLLPELGLGERDWLTSGKLLQWVGVTVALVLALGVVDSVRLHGYQQQTKEAAAQLANLEQQYEAVLVTLQGMGDTATLQASIKSLEKRGKRQRELLQRLNRGGEQDAGLAKFLLGLGSSNMSGIWFTEIEVREGGQQLLLRGRAQTASAVPQILRSLRNEPAFSQQQFSLLQITASEDLDLLDFVIRSSREGES